MKRVTLTFDNGPHPVGTPEILEVLTQRGLKATFFLVGEKLREPALQALATQIQSQGHRIANHTMTHSVALGRTTGVQQAQEEIGEAQRLVAGYGAARLFRPNGEKGQLGPHMLSEDAVEYLESNGFTAVSWNAVPQDWIGPEGAWVERAEKQIREQEWPVVVLHDHCQAGAIQHLEGFLDRLMAQQVDFRFDFPDDVLLLQDGKRGSALAGNYTPRVAGAPLAAA